MKLSIKLEIFLIVLVIISWGLGLYFYSIFPDQVPVHWNIQGQVDRFGSKFEGAFIMPIVVTAMYVLFWFLPKIDPKKDKYQQFAKVYNIFKTVIILLMFAIYFITAFNTLGYNVKVEIWIPLIIGGLFLIIGNYMGKIKTNWFMGIRTPWTLSSEEVWNKTHRLGGKLFMLLGIVMMLSPILPYQSLFWTILFPVLIVVIVPLIYSYISYKKLKK